MADQFKHVFSQHHGRPYVARKAALQDFADRHFPEAEKRRRKFKVTDELMRAMSNALLLDQNNDYRCMHTVANVVLKVR